jgi:hypothetical protein
MAKFSVRITNEEGKITAWIDQDGNICIAQLSVPGSPEGSTWATEDEALAWANAHAANLEAQHQAGLQAQAEANAMIEQAKIDSQKIAEIHEMLAALAIK